jgi:hypothetical protein
MNLRKLQSNPAAFQADLHVPTGGGARRFGDVMADFQRERFALVNPSLLAVTQHKPPPVPRVWDERTKGASKDTDWAVNLLWLLAFSRRPLRIQIGAYDQSQADEIRLIVKGIIHTDGPLNQFLGATGRGHPSPRRHDEPPPQGWVALACVRPWRACAKSADCNGRPWFGFVPRTQLAPIGLVPMEPKMVG